MATTDFLKVMEAAQRDMMTSNSAQNTTNVAESPSVDKPKSSHQKTTPANDKGVSLQKIRTTNTTYVGVFEGIFEEERFRVADRKGINKNLLKSIQEQDRFFRPDLYTTKDRLKELGLADKELDSVKQFGFKISRLMPSGDSRMFEVVSEGLRASAERGGIQQGDRIAIVNTYKKQGDKDSSHGFSSNKYEIIKFDNEAQMTQAVSHYKKMDEIKSSIADEYNRYVIINKKNAETKEGEIRPFKPSFVEFHDGLAGINVSQLNLISLQMMVLSEHDRNNVFSPSQKDVENFDMVLKEALQDEACRKNGYELIKVLMHSIKDYDINPLIAQKMQLNNHTPAKDSLLASFEKSNPSLVVLGQNHVLDLSSDAVQDKSLQSSRDTSLGDKNTRNPKGIEDIKLTSALPKEVLDKLEQPVGSKTAANEQLNGLKGDEALTPVYTGGLDNPMPIFNPAMGGAIYGSGGQKGFSFNISLNGNPLSFKGLLPDNLLSKFKNRSTSKVYDNAIETVNTKSPVGAHIGDIPVLDKIKNSALKVLGVSETLSKAPAIEATEQSAHNQDQVIGNQKFGGMLEGYGSHIQTTVDERRQGFLSDFGQDALNPLFEQSYSSGFDKNTDYDNMKKAALTEELTNIRNLDEQYLQDEVSNTSGVFNQLTNNEKFDDKDKAQTLVGEEEIASEAVRNRNKQQDSLDHPLLNKLAEMAKVAAEAAKALVEALARLFKKSSNNDHSPNP